MLLQHVAKHAAISITIPTPTATPIAISIPLPIAMISPGNGLLHFASPQFSQFSQLPDSSERESKNEGKRERVGELGDLQVQFAGSQSKKRSCGNCGNCRETVGASCLFPCLTCFPELHFHFLFSLLRFLAILLA